MGIRFLGGMEEALSGARVDDMYHGRTIKLQRKIPQHQGTESSPVPHMSAKHGGIDGNKDVKYRKYRYLSCHLTKYRTLQQEMR